MKELFKPGGFIWYTDGSKDSLGTGAGICGKKHRTEISITLGTFTTVFKAETKAIKASLKKSEHAYEGQHTYICSHSQTALKAFIS